MGKNAGMNGAATALAGLFLVALAGRQAVAGCDPQSLLACKGFDDCDAAFKSQGQFCEQEMKQALTELEKAGDRKPFEAAKAEIYRMHGLFVQLGSLQLSSRGDGTIAYVQKPTDEHIPFLDFFYGKEKDLEKLVLAAERRLPDKVLPPGKTPQEDPKKEKLGKIAQDEKRLNEVGSKDPEPYREVGRDYLEAGSPAAAERALNKSLELKNDDPESLSLRSLVRIQSGNMEGALADARAALARDPGNKLAGEVAAFAGASLRKHSFKDVKRPGLKSIWGDMPDGGVAVTGAADPAPGAAGKDWGPDAAAVAGAPGTAVLMGRASRRLGLGDFQGALLDATRVLEARPSDPAAWALRARISNHLKNHSGALSDADHALRLDPKNAAALRERAYANYELGDYRKALEDADAAVRLEPSNATGYLYRAMIREKLGMTEEALADFETAARLDPALRPLAEEAARRMGRGSPSAVDGGRLPSKAGRYWFRGLAGLASLALILLGGRAFWRKATGVLGMTPAGPAGGARTLPLGSVLGGNFRIEGELGRGGMGVVYLAYDLTLKRAVAVKQVRVLGDESQEGAFKEARLVAQLKHPNLVPIFSVVEDAGLYLVFELADGETLDKTLARRGRLSLEEIRPVLGGVCAAVGYAHSRRIIHRDLKPANVIVTPGGAAKVMDFGIAHESRTTSRATRAEAWGTPEYMAPEQMHGEVSKASDLFSLGVLTYELLTGELPFASGDAQSRASGRFRSARETNPGLSETADVFFAKALAPRPEDRFPGAREFLAAFEDLARGAKT